MAEAAVRRIRFAQPGFVVPLLFTDTVTLTRGPYLQSDMATSAIVVGRTDQPGTRRIDYGVGTYTHPCQALVQRARAFPTLGNPFHPVVPQSFSADFEGLLSLPVIWKQQ